MTPVHIAIILRIYESQYTVFSFTKLYYIVYNTMLRYAMLCYALTFAVKVARVQHAR